MKGLVIEKAIPSNGIDVYPLIKEAMKEGCYNGPLPTDREMKEIFYPALIYKQLSSPAHIYLLAKRGRGFLGFLHAVLAPDRWTGKMNSVFIDMIFVIEKRRKMGVGKKLINHLCEMKEIHDLEISNFDFICPPDLVEYWKDKRSATEKGVFMRCKR